MKKILVTGAGGQLGSELQQLSVLYTHFQFHFTNSKELPIEDEAAVEQYFATHQPDFCINCAAYTAVDKAESEPEKAMLVNGTAVGFLAGAATRHNCRLLHISTDYVFDGSANVPISEDAPVKPLGAYGLSKLKGEELALSLAPDSIIIRTSWVYSAFGNNFLKTMIRLMGERKELNVVCDQFGCPTYAADLAKAILDIIVFLELHPHSREFGGIYNYTNKGIISWYDFAVTIRDLIHSPCVVHPIPTTAYPTPARRPAYSVLNTRKIRETFSLPVLPWKESLQHCILQLQQYLAG
jgi:dTDP-4-dehydrorhamnose reductase